MPRFYSNVTMQIIAEDQDQAENMLEEWFAKISKGTMSYILPVGYTVPPRKED